jgi:hypothetical protein
MKITNNPLCLLMAWDGIGSDLPCSFRIENKEAGFHNVRKRATLQLGPSTIFYKDVAKNINKHMYNTKTSKPCRKELVANR